MDCLALRIGDVDCEYTRSQFRPEPACSIDEMEMATHGSSRRQRGTRGRWHPTEPLSRCPYEGSQCRVDSLVPSLDLSRRLRSRVRVRDGRRRRRLPRLFRRPGRPNSPNLQRGTDSPGGLGTLIRTRLASETRTRCIRIATRRGNETDESVPVRCCCSGSRSYSARCRQSRSGRRNPSAAGSLVVVAAAALVGTLRDLQVACASPYRR